MDEKNNLLSRFFSLLDTVGRRLKPKTILVELLSSSPSEGVFAAYTMAQGKRAGRKTDFSGSFHLDGLIVDRFTPPDCGLVLFLPQLSDVEVGSFEVNLQWCSPWDVAHIHQVLVTNGRRWMAFVRDHDESFAVRESCFLPEDMAGDVLPGGNWDMPDALSEFNQYLARALVSWKNLETPDTLGTFFASYATSCLIDFVRDSDHTRILTQYANVLQNRLGIAYSDFGGEMFPLYHFIAASLLDAVACILHESCNSPLETDAPDEMGYLYGRVRPKKHPQELDHIRIVADTLRKNTHPDFTRSFCEVFWKILTGDARACESWNRISRDGYHAHIDLLDVHLTEDIPFFPGLYTEGIGWLDVHAGIGGLLVAALSQSSLKGKHFSGDVCAIEADPVKWQVMRLRIILAGANVTQKSASQKIRLILDNPLRNPRLVTRQTGGIFWILASDLRFPDERGIIISGNEQLTKQYQQNTRDGFGIRTFNGEEPFAQYAALVEVFLQHQVNAAAILFSPATWLEKDAHVAVRGALLDQAKSIMVNVLPNDSTDSAGARKDGIASIILVKSPVGVGPCVSGREIRYKEDIKSVLCDSDTLTRLSPSRDNRFSLLPAQTTPGYQSWPSLRELTVVNPVAGPSEQRGFSLIRHNPDELTRQMRDYFDSHIDNGTLTERYPRLMADGARYKAGKTREQLLGRLFFSEQRITPYPFKPFDTRWAYLDELRPLFKEPASELQALAAIPGNAFLVVCEPNDRASTGLSAWFSPFICDYDFFAGTARHFPMYFRKTPKRSQHGTTVAPNLSNAALDYVHTVFAPDTEHDGVPIADSFWYYVLAVLFTPKYYQDNADALRRDWPKIPVPFWKRPYKSRQSGNSSFQIFTRQGRRIAELLAMKPLKHGDWPVLDTVALLADDAAPIRQGNFLLSSVWSVKSKINAVRPGKGETRFRHYTAKEEDDLAMAMRNYRIDWQDVRETFGSKTVDVLLCDDIWWKNIPEAVWEFEIGGYKVLRKWLSYRGENVYGRELTVEDCAVFSDIARRLTILVLVGLALNYSWPRLVDEAGK